MSTTKLYDGDCDGCGYATEMEVEDASNRPGVPPAPQEPSNEGVALDLLLGGFPQPLEALQHYMELASYLHKGGDLAAGIYFYCRSANVASCEATPVAAEAFYKMGMIKTELMDLQGGIITLERALESSSDSDSSTAGPNLSHLIAADLATLYMRLADDADFWAADSEQPLQQSNAEKCDALVVAGRVWSSMACYERALECAQLSSDEVIEGLASFKLGTARLQDGDLEGALALQRRYLEISQQFADLKGEAAARAVLSKIYQRLGDKRAAIEELDILRKVAEDAGEITTAADACLDLALLTYREDEVKAAKLLEGYYQLSRRAADRGRQGSAAVLMGLASGRAMMHHVAKIFEEDRGIYELLRWKDTPLIERLHDDV
ncbi:hypothetical protein FOL46_008560 [Perkinsus olseni]|uniref:Tetratricopeptide repeat protein 29 n=1 Tax=Perkinsus olseni TaxID=32597 RepID=A0A7J6L6E2_PEROL|nr:hypothetical protein FOL46_008560 [Perkinsus olseni]